MCGQDRFAVDKQFDSYETAAEPVGSTSEQEVHIVTADGEGYGSHLSGTGHYALTFAVASREEASFHAADSGVVRNTLGDHRKGISLNRPLVQIARFEIVDNDLPVGAGCQEQAEARQKGNGFTHIY